jgi:AGCS family alanine or glycine:cation symporter
MKKTCFLIILLFILSISIEAKSNISANDSLTQNVVNVNMPNNKKTGQTFSQRINIFFEPIVDKMGTILFWDPFAAIGIYDPVVYDDKGNPALDENGKIIKSPIPFVVVWLILGALFFTIFMKFINIKGFKTAIDLIRGRYDNPKNKGQISHFQALATALSATIGLGNIAGVAIAISLGGPGAVFWLIIAGFLGMSSKFVECSLAVKYRKIDKDGKVSGGPMYYLSRAWTNKYLKILGKILALAFAVFVVIGSLGIGNMFQSNQAFAQLVILIPSVKNNGAYFGIVLAILVGLVIIGGIKSIAKVTSKIVPFMAALYILSALFIIMMNITDIGNVCKLIYYGAFNASAMKGGFIGVMIIGFRRAAFSNEAGIGSAAIAHSSAKTNEHIAEGLVASLGPFIDTIIICTMTALVLIFTGAYKNPGNLEGTQLTSMAFESVFSWFPYVLLIAVLLFAFSTMISWSYYGLKGFDYLFGGLSDKMFGNRKVTDTIYRISFLIFIVIGASTSINSVVDFSDMMILCMAFPNILGLIILSPEIKKDLTSYIKRIKNGDIKRYK